jgi:endonuclease/exonuclease/phosphatase family metal-dependent hydrolase
VQLRAATFNVHHGTRPGVRPWPWRTVPQLRASVAALDADIIGTQEIDRFSARSWFVDQARLVARAAAAPAWHFALARRILGGQYGNAIAVRGTIESHEVFALPKPAGTEPRVAQFAAATVRGSTITVVNTHLQNGDDPAALLQLDALLAEVARTRTGPVVLLGDLNLAPEQFAPVLAAAGFVLPPETKSVPWDDPVVQVDVVAVAGGAALDAAALEVPTSDHRPVVATLEL